MSSQRERRAFAAVCLAIVAANLLFWGVIIYVALHFIGKAW